MDDDELRVLKKYKKGRVVDVGDEFVLYRYCSIGYVRLGISTEGEEPRETARLTDRGFRTLKYEVDMRNPLKRILFPFITR